MNIIMQTDPREEVLISKYGTAIEHMKQKEQYHSFSACVDAGYDIKRKHHRYSSGYSTNNAINTL